MNNINKIIKEIKNKLDYNSNLTVDEQLDMYCYDLEVIESHEVQLTDEEFFTIQDKIRE